MEFDEKTCPKDDADLEDGEIESDDEDDVVTDKITNVEEVNAVKNDDGPKLHNTQGSDAKYPQIVDEWAVRVEKAIANVLKKDGIEVAEPSERVVHPPIKVAPGSSTQKRPRDLGGRNGAEEMSKNARRRKRKRDDKEAKRKLLPAKGDAASTKSDSVDDYEMLCVRGGSPPRREYDNESEHSYSSYSSYDSGEYRRQRKRPRDRRRGGGGGGPGKHFDKRRQHHDSDVNIFFFF